MHVQWKRHSPDRNLIKCLGEGDQKSLGKNWLPLELVVEDNLRDRRRDSFVGINLSQSAKTAMIQNWDMAEAYWCRLLCPLYLVSCNCILCMVYGRQFDTSWNIWWKIFYANFYYSSTDVWCAFYMAFVCLAQGHNSNVDRRLLLYRCIDRKWHLWATIDIES